MREFKKLLLEFSESKSDIKYRIIAVEEQIFQHLIKIYLLSENINVSHWAQEIYSFITKFSRVKWAKSKKQLEPEFYYNNLVLGPLTDSNQPGDWNLHGIKMELEVLGSKYPEIDAMVEKVDIPKMMNKIDNFYKEICILVSENKISKNDVTRLINEYVKN